MIEEINPADVASAETKLLRSERLSINNVTIDANATIINIYPERLRKMSVFAALLSKSCSLGKSSLTARLNKKPKPTINISIKIVAEKFISLNSKIVLPLKCPDLTKYISYQLIFFAAHLSG